LQLLYPKHVARRGTTGAQTHENDSKVNSELNQFEQEILDRVFSIDNPSRIFLLCLADYLSDYGLHVVEREE
jgi:hypothetical protein